MSESKKNFRARVEAITRVPYRDIPLSHDNTDVWRGPIMARRGDVFVVAALLDENGFAVSDEAAVALDNHDAESVIAYGDPEGFLRVYIP